MKNTSGDPVLVLPTAAGKSIIIAEICRGLAKVGYKAVVLCRQKELISQNKEKLNTIAPDITTGVYCAGLGKKQTTPDVIFGTVQSLAEKACDIGERHLVIIDECHQLPRSESGQYATFLSVIKTCNPKLRVLGLTATPYRLDCGHIIGEGQPFDGIAYTVPVKTMLDGGYITPLKSIGVSTVDTSEVTKSGWDFNNTELANCFEAVVKQNAAEIVQAANQHSRRKCLAFTTSVKHAGDLREELERLTGEDVGLILGDTIPLMRSTILSNFANGSLRWLVNCSVLTTGFDAPSIDLIAVCRATLSPALFAQICGRGLRKHPGKKDCLLLDFGGNVKRHGPIDADDYGINSIKGVGGEGEAPFKECPNCEALVPAGTRVCECGFKFPRAVTIESNADGIHQVMQAGPTSSWWRVTNVEYHGHSPKDESKPMSMRVDYQVEAEDSEGGNLSHRRFSEWVCFEHEGFARSKAESWWRKRSRNETPETVWEAVELASKGALSETSRILVKPDGKYSRIVQHVLDVKPARVELDDEEAPF